MKKFLRCSTIVLGAGIGLFLLAGLALHAIGMQKLTRSYPDIPVQTTNIPTDADAITRGKHIAVVWLCTRCHGEDLSGKLVEDDPFLGTIPAGNLTSGEGGVATAYTDVDWIRGIRHGVKPNGQVEIMMYDYSTMSDQDLGDLIAYLKQIPSADSNLPAMRIGPILPLAPALGYLVPPADRIDHDALIPANPVPGVTVEYGKYLSTLCRECHSPNIGGKLEAWTQEQFIRAMQTGVLPNGERLGSGMPLYSEMNHIELAALWLHYQSLPPEPGQ